MRSYQLFRIYKRFYKEREKTLLKQSIRIDKLERAGLCLTTDCFIKPFN